ncbi:MAG: diacylglycerol kinase family protein [Saprospiraceae bacterium]
MTKQSALRLLFVTNPRSGNGQDNQVAIREHFDGKEHTIDFYLISASCSVESIREKISDFRPDRVIAVGGDGTIGLVASCIVGMDIPMGIFPTGSANGLAKELGIFPEFASSMATIEGGNSMKIHLTEINGKLCVHLSDIGLNAYAMKKFEMQDIRGMYGYLIASLKVLWQNPRMEIEMKVDDQNTRISAEMVVIANASKYGNGIQINPIGALDDEFFEVIAIKKISILEILKMTFAKPSFNVKKTEIFQTSSLTMRSRKKFHFQIDGEYLGKVKEIKAQLIPAALQILVPEEIK